MAKLTTRTLATGASLNDLIHIVITGDTSQSIDGSSYKATLSQLVPLFGGAPDVYVTGGTAISSGGTISFTNSTGGTFTVSGLTTPFTGGSGSCITSFYTNNIHACLDEITVHNRVQSVGSDAQSILSFAFGDNVKALSDYSHAEGSDTIASGSTSHAEGFATRSFGEFSHSEGANTRTGANTLYLATGLTFGVVYLDSSYGDVSANFGSSGTIYINDINFGGILQESKGEVSASSFIGGQTIIYLTDTSISTSSSCYVGDTQLNPTSWGGNKTAGGIYASTKGLLTNAIGKNSLACGELSHTFSKNSFVFGFGNQAWGETSFVSGQNNKALGTRSFVANKGNIVDAINASAFGATNQNYGTSSIVFGDSNLIYGANSLVCGGSNISYSGTSFVGGSGNLSLGEFSFIYSKFSTLKNENGSILGGIGNVIESGTTENSTIIGGDSNSISGATPSDPVYNSAIIGGINNLVTYYNSSIISSENSILTTDHSVILGGMSISGTQSETVYVPKFVITNSFTPSGTTDPTGETGQITYDSNYFYYRDNIGWKKLSGATW